MMINKYKLIEEENESLKKEKIELLESLRNSNQENQNL